MNLIRVFAGFAVYSIVAMITVSIFSPTITTDKLLCVTIGFVAWIIFNQLTHGKEI